MRWYTFSAVLPGKVISSCGQGVYCVELRYFGSCYKFSEELPSGHQLSESLLA
jgi:hypothetical protein